MIQSIIQALGACKCVYVEDEKVFDRAEVEILDIEVLGQQFDQFKPERIQLKLTVASQPLPPTKHKKSDRLYLHQCADSQQTPMSFETVDPLRE